jgi:WD40 repeat protein
VLASGGADKRILLWNLQNENSPAVFDTLLLPAAPRALAFSPSGNILAAGCEDGATRLVQWPGGEIQTLRGHQKRINSVAFSPDGNLLASGSADKTIRLWDLQPRHSGVDPVVLGEHPASIRSLAFTASGDTLIAGTFGKDILLWLTDTAHLAETIRNQIRRDLTREEWQEFVGADREYLYRHEDKQK